NHRERKKGEGRQRQMGIRDRNIINDLVIREKKMDIILEKLNEEREELKKNESKERRKNAKRAA
ncbi:hypothetical protein ACISK8_05040, partial [Campylobacter coli]